MTEIPSSFDASLRSFIPPDVQNIRIDTTLAPVVERISKVLPQPEIFRLFTSEVKETDGVQNFPNFRVDTAVIAARNNIRTLSLPTVIANKLEAARFYQMASEKAFSALVWVEIGFQGLQNLAHSPASRNWTSAVGHFVNDQERAVGIMEKGKQFYDEFLTQFTRYRFSHDVPKDLFDMYHLESLLTPFK